MRNNEYMKLSYEEMLRAIPTVSYGKEARKLHRALRKYGDGLPLYGRYPNFPLYFSIFSLVFSLIVLLVLI